MKYKPFLVAIAYVFLAAADSPADTMPATQLPAAFLPAAAYHFEEVVEGTEIVHDFIIFNKGTGPLNIRKVETG